MIVFVRHGQSEYNFKKIHQGQIDNPLTEKGENQAREVGEKLRDFKFDVIVCSPLKRAKRTAELINENFNLPVTYDPRLMERDKGTFAGTPYNENSKKEFEDNPKKYNGETIEEFYDRCISVFKDIQNMNKDVLIVAHGGVYRQIFKYLNGLDVHKRIDDMENCGVYICEKEKDLKIKDSNGEL